MQYRYHFELYNTPVDPLTGKHEQVYIVLDAEHLTRVEALLVALAKLREYSQDAAGRGAVNVLGFKIINN